MQVVYEYTRKILQMSKLHEMAQPTKEITNTIFYHGTSEEEYAVGIWEEGLLANLKHSLYRGKINQAMKDHVYLTSSLTTAVDYSNEPSLITDGSVEYGFLILFSGEDLVDIYPDEDDFERILYNYFGNHFTPDQQLAFTWIEKYLDLLEIPSDEWLDNEGLDDEWLTFYPTLRAGLKHGGSEYALASAKVIIPHLDLNEILLILAQDRTHNIAHKGSLHPIEVWAHPKKVGRLPRNWAEYRTNAKLLAYSDSEILSPHEVDE